MALKDTKFTLGRFQKSLEEVSFTDEEEESSQSPTPSALDAKHIIGYAYGGHRPHSDIEHIPNPNAVVIHHQNGIEVLNILTGRPMTRLPLADDGAVYTTLDNENDIKKVSWGEQENFSPCFLEVWRIFPIKEMLERFPLCFSKRLFFTTSWVYDEDMYKKLPPLVIKRFVYIDEHMRFCYLFHMQESLLKMHILMYPVGWYKFWSDASSTSILSMLAQASR